MTVGFEAGYLDEISRCYPEDQNPSTGSHLLFPPVAYRLFAGYHEDDGTITSEQLSACRL